MSNETEIRQGINNVTLIGEVKEQKLHESESEKDGKYIDGSLIIKTNKCSEIEVQVFVQEKNKDGTIKETFAILQNFINGKYITLADRNMITNKVHATRVTIYGKSPFTPYFDETILQIKETGEITTKNIVKLGFANIIINDYSFYEYHKATFNIEMFVDTISKIGTDELIDSVIVKGWTPIHNGTVIPIQIVCKDIVDCDSNKINFVKDILNNIKSGMTVEFWGRIGNNNILFAEGAEEKSEENSFNTKLIKMSIEARKHIINENDKELNNLKYIPYKEYLQTEHWKNTRKKALKKAKYKCELCGSKEDLNVHHKTYEHRGEEPPEDLIVLCHHCHAKFHDKLDEEDKVNESNIKNNEDALLLKQLLNILHIDKDEVKQYITYKNKINEFEQKIQDNIIKNDSMSSIDI
jgi:5-methylcytosine-specific restriction endonuclease McrA